MNKKQAHPAANELSLHVFVSAGAGSGKTTELIQRYVAALRDPRLRLDQVVAVTFTEKAAAELKDRARQEFRKLANSEPNSELWRARERGLENAPVSTIHALCARILREHPVEAGVDPQFAVLDEDPARELCQQAIHDAVLKRVQSSQEMRLLVGALGFDDLCAEFVRWIQRRHEWEDLDLTADRWSEATEAYLRQRVEPVIERVAEAMDALAPGAEADETATGQKKIQAIRAAGAPLLKSWKAVQGQGQVDYGLLLKHLAALGEAVKGGGGRKNGILLGIVGSLRQRIKDLPLDYDPAGEASARERSRAFTHEIREVLKAYDQAKQQIPGLDFDDLLSQSRNLLRDNETVRRKYARRIRHLLIDEFQDTDRVQRELLWYLAGAEPTPHGPSFPPSAARVFVVGDEKQSIYRFRRADVSVFAETRELFRQAETQGCAIRGLQTNYRSTPALVDGVFNPLFSNPLLMGEGQPQDLHEARYTRMRPYREPAGRLPPLEVIFALPGDEDKPFESIQEARRVEAHAIARRIGELASQEAQYSDIAILFRASTEMAIYERALREHDIPYHSVRGRGLYHQQEVKDLINLLKLLSDPADDVALMGFLRSPMVAVSDETLYWLCRQRTLREGLECAAGEDESTRQDSSLRHIAEDELAKLRRGMRVLEDLWSVKDRLSFAELLERAIADTGFTAALAGLWDGKQRVANVRRVIEVAREFDAAGTRLLNDLADYLEGLVTFDPREAAAPIFAEKDDVVTLTTIHSAKGLEWPIVVVADLGRKRQQPRLGPSVRHPDAGFVLCGERENGETAKPVLYEAVSDREAQLDDFEERRLFYVACTRARDLLILSAGLVNPKATLASSWLAPVCEALQINPANEPGLYPIPGANNGATFRLIVAHQPEERRPSRPAKVAPVSVKVHELQRRLLPIPIRPAQPRLTVRQLSIGLRCPWELHLAVNQGIPEYVPRTAVVAAAWSDQDRGDVAHRVLQWLASHPENGRLAAPQANELRSLVVNAADELLLPLEKEARVSELSDNIAAIWSWIVTRFGPQAAVQPEVSVTAQLGAGIVDGKIDAIVRTDDAGMHVLDYKTGRLSGHRTPEYRFQVALYCYAVEAAIGVRPQSATIISVDRPGAALHLDLASELEPAVKRAEKLIHAWAKGSLEPAANSPCDSCLRRWACTRVMANATGR